MSREPLGALAPFVERIWFAPASAARQETILPRGGTDLVLTSGARACTVQRGSGAVQTVAAGPVVIGPCSRPYVLTTPASGATVGVSLTPTGARALLGVALSELRDRHVPVAELGNAELAVLGERVREAVGRRRKVALVEQALSRLLVGADLRPHPIVEQVTAQLAARPERCSVRRLGDLAGFSTRRLEQLFRRDVGLSPKAYQRLQRFRRVLDTIDGAADAGWAAFALDRGYCDQSHLIGDFRAHAAITPSAYFAVRGRHLNHLATGGVSG
jgi:AraC-like DNA-binding protein